MTNFPETWVTYIRWSHHNGRLNLLELSSQFTPRLLPYTKYGLSKRPRRSIHAVFCCCFDYLPLLILSPACITFNDPQISMMSSSPRDLCFSRAVNVSLQPERIIPTDPINASPTSRNASGLHPTSRAPHNSRPLPHLFVPRIALRVCPTSPGCRRRQLHLHRRTDRESWTAS